jgi:hypothetical protein
MLTGAAAIVADGVGMDVDQSGRLADTTALVDVLQDREDLLLRQAGAIQRCALAFGEAVPAGAAIKQAKLAVLAESAGDGEISGAATSEVGAVGIQATKLREIVHGVMYGLEAEVRKGLEILLSF